MTLTCLQFIKLFQSLNCSSIWNNKTTLQYYLVSLKEGHHFIRLCQVRWHSKPHICIYWLVVIHIPSSDAIWRYKTVEVCWWMRYIQSSGTATGRRGCDTICVSICVCPSRTDCSVIYWICAWHAKMRVVGWRDLGLINWTAGDYGGNIQPWAGKYFDVSLSHVLSVKVIGSRHCTIRWYKPDIGISRGSALFKKEKKNSFK